MVINLLNYIPKDRWLRLLRDLLKFFLVLQENKKMTKIIERSIEILLGAPRKQENEI